MAGRGGEQLKTIPLTQGMVALVDDSDYEMLSRYKWRVHKSRNTCYAKTTITTATGRETVQMHWMIMGRRPGFKIDHRNGNGLDNQRGNLRYLTHRQNLQNLHNKRSSGYPGVSLHKLTGKWDARIRINGKPKYLGLHNTEEEAFAAYCQALESIGERVLTG